MKRFSKLLILIVAFVCLFSLTSCAGSHADVEKWTVENGTIFRVENDTVKYPEIKETETLVGFYYFDDKEGIGRLYFNLSTIPNDVEEVEIITIETKTKVDKNGIYSFPSTGHGRDGYQFAGWYPTDKFVNGEKLTTNDSLAKYNEGRVKEGKLPTDVIYAKYITITESAIVSIVSIVVVFSMLALLWGIVALFKYLPSKKQPEKKAEPAKAPVANAPQKAITIEDIKDEDMMAAALVATIDYHNETNEDVRVVSIKQIG